MAGRPMLTIDASSVVMNRPVHTSSSTPCQPLVRRGGEVAGTRVSIDGRAYRSGRPGTCVALLTRSGDCPQGFNDLAAEFPQQLTQCGYGLLRRRSLQRFGQLALFDAENGFGRNVAKAPARGQFSAPGRVRLETQHVDLHLIS